MLVSQWYRSRNRLRGNLLNIKQVRREAFDCFSLLIGKLRIRVVNVVSKLLDLCGLTFPGNEKFVHSQQPVEDFPIARVVLRRFRHYGFSFEDPLRSSGLNVCSESGE